MESGTYQHVTKYYIHRDIPPKIQPPHPSRVLSWDTKDLPPRSLPTTTPQQAPNRRTCPASPSRSTASTVNDDEGREAALRGRIFTPPGSPTKSPSSRQPTATTFRARPGTNQQPFVLEGLRSSMTQLRVSSPTPSDRAAREPRALTNEMKHVLTFLFPFSEDDFSSLDAILGSPEWHGQVKQVLAESGMTREEAHLFGDWMLGTLPVFEWERVTGSRG